MLKVGSGAAAADGFAGLGRLLWPVGGAGRIGAGSAGWGTGLAGGDQAPRGQPAHGVSQRLAQLTALDGKLLAGRGVIHHDSGRDAERPCRVFRADWQPHPEQALRAVGQAVAMPQHPVRGGPLRQPGGR